MSTTTVSGEFPAAVTLKARRICIHEKFEQQARRTPEATALSFGNEHLTYKELNERANQLAAHLRALGVGPEVPVVLYLERSLDMVVAILGVLKAGGAYVPIDLAYPAERVAFMLEDTQAPVMITQEKFRPVLPNKGAHTLCIDSEWCKVASQPRSNPPLIGNANNLAYVIYTSGSTGKPKGVMVTHHNVVRLLEQAAPWYRFNETDVWLLFHSYAFDVSVWELWGSLFNGGRLIVVPYLITRSPGELYELLARERVTVLNQTPSAFRQLIWAEASAANKLELQLRYVVCAGEALELQSLKPWFALHGDQRPQIVNMYGITETTVHSTFRIIRTQDLENGLGSVVGIPIPDLQIHLVDEELRPVPTGTPGEICVGGAGVARGYLNRPELTATRFLADPFSTEPDAKLYRSGDLAQYTADGELEYLGRMDHQVKIRGFRVELGEIESALNRHPAIRESVAVATGSVGAEKRLVAYYVPVASPVNVSELREFLAQKLPDYIVPAVFMAIERLPLTTNGKVDRRALPTPDGSRPRLRAIYVAPRTAEEQTLARIWSEVLAVEPVGVSDNFFELGGDSIRAIGILSRAQNAGIQLTLQQLFQHPTIEGLARCAGSADTGTTESTSVQFSLISEQDKTKLPSDAEDAYPIATLQLGMFFRNELNPSSAMYHDVFSYRVKSIFDAGKLQNSVDSLAERHTVLRTSFHLAGYSVPMQVVHRRVQVPFTWEDLGGAAPEAQQARIGAWIEQEKRRPFDRTQPPLARFHVQILDRDHFQLFLSFHHSCIDGWSLAAAITEVLKEYSNLLRNEAAPLAAPRSLYREFVALERKAISFEDSRKFWSEQFQDSVMGQLPRWPKQYCTGGLEQNRGPEIVLEPVLVDRIKALALQTGVPLKTVLLSAHQAVMSYLCGQSDTATGLISNGRPESMDGEKLIGLFLNAVPLRMQLEGGSWLDLIQQTFRAEQNLLPHRRFPMAEVQRLHGGRPLFETAFDYVHFHVFNSLGRELEFEEGPYFEANDLTLYTSFIMHAAANRLELHIDYDPNCIAREQIQQITEMYVMVLSQMADQPESHYESLVPLAPAELRKLVYDWNATQQAYRRDKRVHELFAESVATAPGKIAVVGADSVLTYGELNARAEALAQRLRRRGVIRNALVGLFVDRSPEMLVALLGILKADAAYVPLDPAFPAERLKLMLEDSRPQCVITQKSLVALLPSSAAEIVLLDESGDIDADHASDAVSVGSPDDLAYVIYTSGSTGKPKGVEVQHRAVVNLLQSAARTTGFDANHRFLAVTTLSFDIAGLELFMPIIHGGTVIVAPRESTGDGKALAALLETSGATFMQGTPATWRLLLESGWQGKPDLTVICGGEALKSTLAADLIGRVKDVWNFYGPTESTIWSTAWRVVPGTVVSIGRPLANTQVYILDPKGRSLPVGGIGELHIAGDGLACGYRNRPELTAERFVRNPFVQGVTMASEVPVPSQRMYKTGDLARYLPDGTIECLGRIDHQVKVRGFRIELGDVETALRKHGGIADALVTAREDAFGEKRLIGYIISKNGPPEPAALREHLLSSLPGYMVPAQFVLLAEFPLTPNGKVDLRRLPAPDSVSSIRRNPGVMPRTADEQWLADIWKEVLSIEQVGLEDNFFELGGDSLSATRAFARINKLFSTDLSLRDLFENPTIAGLARIVQIQKGSRPAESDRIPRLPRV